MVSRSRVLFAVFLLSLCAFAWSLLFRSNGKTISFHEFVALIPITISLIGTAKERKRRQLRVHEPFRLAPSFDRGLYGGLAGGALAGLTIGLVWYFTFRAMPRVDYTIVPRIFICAALLGTMLGAASQLSILWFRHRARVGSGSTVVLNDFVGGILGCMTAGIPVGVLGSLLFWRDPIPVVERSGLLVFGAVLCALCVVLGMLLYDFERDARKIIRAVLVSFVVVAIAATMGTALLAATQDPVTALLFGNAFEGLLGGAIIGLIVGLMLGFQIGATIWLYRQWDSRASPSA